jgi:hypothetical protein
MSQWFRNRLESLIDNIIFAALVTGGGIVWAAIGDLPIAAIAGIGILVFALLISIIRLIAYSLRKSEIKENASFNNISEIHKQTKKEQAKNLHNEIIDLERKLWETRDNLPKEVDVLKNPDIKQILDDLQNKMNALGYLINKREYNLWVESLMEMYSRDLEYSFDMHGGTGMWGRARINTKFREFINKIKG